MPQEAAVWEHLAEGGDKHPSSLTLPLLSVGEQESCLRMRHCWFPLPWSELCSYRTFPSNRANAGVASWELTQKSDVKGSWKNETLLNPMLDQFPDQSCCTKGAWELMCARKVTVGEAGLVLAAAAWT